jgi:ABC-type oligopeptide transport system ATPase subunit
MYLGEIVEIGPRAAVFGNPQHPYTKKLMAAVPIPNPARRTEKRGVSNDEIMSPPITNRRSASTARSRRATSSRFGAKSGQAIQQDVIVIVDSARNRRSRRGQATDVSRAC